MSVEYIKRLAGPYVGDGTGQKTFSFGFLIFEESDVYVAVATSSDSESSNLQQGTDYTVSMNADQSATPGGTITLTSETGLAKDAVLVIGSAVDYTQTLDLTNYTRFPPERITTELDRIVVMIQQIVELLGRVVQVPPTSSISPSDLFYQLLTAAESAAQSAEDAAASLAACEQIRQLIEQYSWDIPHIVDSLRDVENYPYDGLFAVGGYGDAGRKGQNISNRYVKAEGSTELRTLGERFADIVNVRDFGAVGDGVHDDTEAFNNALKVSKVAFVPLGEYVVDSEALNHGVLFGAGNVLGSAGIDGFRLGQDKNLNTLAGGGAGKALRFSIHNTIVGYNAGAAVVGDASDPSVGSENVIVGAWAGSALTEGQRNICVGYRAGDLLTTGNLNVFIQPYTSSESGEKTGDYNVVVGSHAGKSLTSGESNSFYGCDAGASSTTAKDNVAVGQAAMQNNTTGSGNTYVGCYAGTQTGTGNANVAVGRSALFRNEGGSNNVAIGREALCGISNSGASPEGSTAVGFQALAKHNGSLNNVAVGCVAGVNLTTGSNNVFVGQAAGDTVTTGSDNVLLGQQAGYEMDGTYSNVVAIGRRSPVSGSNQFQLGNASHTPYAYAALQLRSDERDKADIQDTSLGLDFILKLHPVDYRWDYRDDYVSFENVLDENGNDIVKAKIHAKDGSKKRTRFHHGFIAQDIEALIKETGIDFGGYQDHLINGGGDVKSLGYEEFIAPMVKAIQELSSRVEALEKRVAIVEAQ